MIKIHIAGCFIFRKRFIPEKKVAKAGQERGGGEGQGAGGANGAWEIARKSAESSLHEK
jgi:hypothetical protein